MGTKTTSTDLFEGFKQVSKEEWKAKAVKDLKGADFDESLVWKTKEGFNVAPYFNQEDLSGLSPVKGNLPDEEAFRLNGSPRHWVNSAYIPCGEGEEKQQNKAALHALNNGADGLYFDLKDQSFELKKLLEGIKGEYCRLSFRIKEGAEKHFLGQLAESGQDLAKIAGNLICPNLAPLPRETEIISPSFKTLTFRAKSDTLTGEVAALLLEVHQFLEKASAENISDAKKAIGQTAFETALGNDFFMEIAKQRSLRFLANEVFRAYGAESNQTDLQIHAFTKPDTALQGDEAYTNMLGNTTQAIAAVLGGANALTVLPHDLEKIKNPAFSARISRNVSNILKEESYLDKTADPVAGSYYMESLTEKFSKSAWEKFQALL